VTARWRARGHVAVAAVVLLSGAGCDRLREPAAAPVASATTTTRPRTYDARRTRPTGTGVVAGVVRLAGPVPRRSPLVVDRDLAVCGTPPPPAEDLLIGERGGVQGAVVWVDSLTGPPPAIPPGALVIEERGCRFMPRVLLLPAGATVEFRNADGILHHVHTHSIRNSPFERAQSPVHPNIRERFDVPEVIGVTCDAHAWMRAWIVVQAHRFYALTDAAGRFRLPDVPAGPQRVTVWHERLGTRSEPVTVDAARPARLVFGLNAR
jgi:plastocyanin